jgi:hypothetical protein
MISPMKMTPKSTEEYTRFEDSLRKVLQVSYSEMQDRLAAEKKAKESKSRPSSRASRDKG